MRRAGSADDVLYRLKLTAVFRPADAVLPIPRAHDRRRSRPRNREIGIVMPYGHIAVRSMELIDAVNDVGDFSQRLETMQEPTRNVDLGAVLIIEQEGPDLAEGRRTWPSIDNHIQNGTVGAANQLRLARTRSTVQSAAYALIGPRLVLLLETGRIDTRFGEDLNVERTGKVTALVPDRRRSKDDQIVDLGPNDLHARQPSEIREIISIRPSRTMLGKAVAEQDSLSRRLGSTCEGEEAGTA